MRATDDQMNQHNLSTFDIIHAEEEMEEMKEEFQKRLGQSDKTINELKEERTRLQQLLQQANAGSNSTEQRITELEASVASLSEEGETLSKKNGEQESALRKLRQANKDLEAEKEKLAARLKSLETLLLEANDRSAREAQAASSQIEELERDAKELRIELKKQTQESRREVQEALAKAEEESAKGLDHQLALSHEREATITTQLQDLRAMMHAMSEENANKENEWRRQMMRLEERSRQLEAEKEAATSSASEASRPLLKQIESMAASSAAAAEAAEQAEQRLMVKLKAAEADRASAFEAERVAVAKLAVSEASASAAAAAAAAAVSQAAEMKGRADSEKREASAAEAEKTAAESRLANALLREEKSKSELEVVSREMAERVWDAEQRIRSLTTERDELMRRLEAQSIQKPGPALLSASSIPASQAPVSLTVDSRVEQGSSAVAEVKTFALEGAEAGFEPDVDGLLAELSKASDFNRTQVSSTRKSSVGFFGLMPSLSSSQQTPSEGTQGITNPGQVQRTILVLRERQRAAERERDETAERLFDAMKRSDEREADCKAVTELRQQLAEAGEKVDFGETV